MRTSRFVVVAALLVSALGAASCGSNDDVTTPPAGSGGDGGVVPTGADGGGDASPKGTACDGGSASLPAHRSGSPSCSMTRGPGIASDGGTRDGGAACASDSDCTAGNNGRCGYADVRERFLSCSYDECFADSDCAAGSVCLCGTRNGTFVGADTCVPSTCGSDTDCAPGFSCSASGDFTCANYDELEGYYCHSTKDDCLDDCDCGGDAGSGFDEQHACRYNQSAAKWTCITGTCEG